MIELRSDAGLVARFALRGARLVSVIMPDAQGREAEILTGTEADFAGAVCGRYANRIVNARFELDGRAVQLAANEGPNSLHGGPRGFDKCDWDVAQSGNEVMFDLVSPDGDQGFPGVIEVKARYALKGDTLSLTLKAQCSAPTVVNLTNHAYWNLAGGGSALGHELQIHAGRYLPVDSALIPTGEIALVDGTEFDYRTLRPIATAKDHNFCLTGSRGTLRPVAVLHDPASGRRIDLATSEAGLQLYTAQHFTAPLTPFGGIALEPQTWPDAPNHPEFPSAVLRPGQTYRHTMTWRFTADEV